MEPLDYWKLCDRITVFQAIMLFLNIDPQHETSYYVENENHQPVGYVAIKTAFIDAILSGKIQTEIVPEQVPGIDSEVENAINSVDIDRTKLSIDAVRNFLSSRGITKGFFFSEPKPISSDYLDRANPSYAPKLAAAVSAWLAVTNDADALRGKSPKQALEKWLRENASQYGLTKDDGNPNETGIEEVSKVANWKLEGGANKTPTQVSGTNPPTKRHKK